LPGLTVSGGYETLLGVFCLSVVSAQVCALSKLAPAPAAFQFQFCRQYELNSCCTVGHDSDIMGNFANLVDVGDNCDYRKRTKAIALHQYYCMACAPTQPSFTRAPTGNSTTPTVLICSDFAQNLWGDGHLYDGCGLRVTTITPICGAGFTECGDNIVIPGSTFASATAFMNAVTAYGFNNDNGNSAYNFLIVNQSQLNPGETCFNMAAGTSASLLITSIALIISWLM